ncbi:small ribosomal subunit protein uS9m isoform X2 [Malania oleifera]|uniref:small ribosomal subunit protein uS9m isoform X2 n=1 Tax=Malania oleifera TaxID=397392 RepID=UPI0025AE1CA4|nr:small ribosomal subunit protein uS9m isoform X2 [Malania oleifera]
MLSRFISKPSHLRFLTLLSSKPQYPKPLHSSLSSKRTSILSLSRYFSTNHSNGDGNAKGQSKSTFWKKSPENDQTGDSVFRNDSGSFASVTDGGAVDTPWSNEKSEEGDVFENIDKEFGAKDGGEVWATMEGYKPWTLGDEEKDDDVFDIGDAMQEIDGVEGEIRVESERREEDKLLEKEEEELKAVLKGPSRAFGDLIAASGITNAMLDNLIALKDFEGVDGLPPLSVIEDIRYEKSSRKSIRSEIERQKREEIAKARVRQVDEKGRAYATGKRKCSIARVWIQPGDGKFIVNDKQFDLYFPDLDHRATLLRPFTETKTLGRWDVNCTVKGGGVSGQVGAIRLGISRALQNWEPGLRPPLRAAGFLTRDSRVVERKKPGKAKARKSFQWVKR